MELKRKKNKLKLGQKIGDTWYPAHIGLKTFNYRWHNPRIYNRKHTKKFIKESYFTSLTAYFLDESDIPKRKYREVADTKRYYRFLKV